jgi:hypothetical protein
MANDLTANTQWSNRPADERFWNLESMRNRAGRYQREAVIKTIPVKDFAIAPNGAELQIVGKNSGKTANFTHWSFGQFCQMLTCPPSFLRTISPNLASNCLMERLAGVDEKLTTMALYNVNGDVNARAFTSEGYGRVWNVDVIDRLIPLAGSGWRIPPARPCGCVNEATRIATEADVLENRMSGLGINVGDTIAPAGLYQSDKDMFAFMVNEKYPIDNDGGSPLYRGFYLTNSEVGAKSVWLTTFLYNSICGNHIAWGVSCVQVNRVIHRGDLTLDRTFKMINTFLGQYSQASAKETADAIRVAKTHELGKDKKEVTEFLYTKDIATYNDLEAAFDTAVEHPEDGGAPTTAWGMASGLTRISQNKIYTEERVELDKAAGKILALVGATVSPIAI